MQNPLTTAWTALRTSGRAWSRLELPSSARSDSELDAEDRSTGADTSEMRRYLAAQTSQVV